MEKNKIIVIGASDAFSLIEDSLDRDKYTILGYIAPEKETSSSYNSYPYLGCDDDLEKFAADKENVFFNCLADNKRRRLLTEKIESFGGNLVTVVHPSCTVYCSAELASGVIVSPQTVISNNAVVRKSVIINYLSLVGHDVFIDEFTFIAPGVKLLNSVKVGSNVFIGANAVVIPGVNIGNNSKISAGLVVQSDVPENTLLMQQNKVRKITLK